jgi:hypothetical protein
MRLGDYHTPEEIDLYLWRNLGNRRTRMKFIIWYDELMRIKHGHAGQDVDSPYAA